MALRGAAGQPEIAQEASNVLAHYLHLQERLLAIAGRLALEDVQAARRECALPRLSEGVREVAMRVGKLDDLRAEGALGQ